MKKNRSIIWFISVIVAAGLYLWVYTTVSAEPASAPDARRIAWETAVQITDVATEAESPTISAAPDGSAVTVAYNQKKTNTAFDIYYAQSTDQGDNLITGSIHHEAGAVNSSEVDITHDQNNIAHAIWVMGENDDIVYADESMWATNGAKILYTGDTVLTPDIVATGANTLDAIWADVSSIGVSTIYHMRSTDGGQTWPSSPRVVNDNSIYALTPSPALAVVSGTVYAIWEEYLDFPNETGTVFFAEWSGTGEWGVPIPISNLDHNAHEASILVAGNKILVAYTHRASKENQWLYLSSCLLADNCAQTVNWTVETEPISGGPVGVNAESPWNVFSDLIEYDGCSYAHFHGKSSVYLQENELIWGASSCNEWTVNDERQPLTVPDVQSLFSSLATDDTYLYIIYQQNAIDAGGNPEAHQIFFQRGVEGPPVPRNWLAITYEGGGEGIIDLQPHNTPAGNICTGSCVRAFDVESSDPFDDVLKTTVVFMYPEAAKGSVFEGFTGDDGCAEWAVSMGTDMACTAHFSIAVYLPVIMK